MIDGIPVTDQFSGGSKIEIENSWVQELQVISGTFNAEYGQAQSGIVNVVSKEGRSTYGGRTSFYAGSYLTSRDNVFRSAASPGLSEFNGELSLDGPCPVPAGRFLPGQRAPYLIRMDGSLASAECVSTTP